MREFFHGWRRKVGCVTLLVACAWMGVWIRTYCVLEQMYFQFGARQQGLWTFDGHIYWLGWKRPAGQSQVWSYDAEYQPVVTLDDVESNLRSLGNGSTFPEFVFWTFYPSMFVIPLILLSAYLLLWKPRKNVVMTHTSETPHA